MHLHLVLFLFDNRQWHAWAQRESTLRRPCAANKKARCCWVGRIEKGASHPPRPLHSLPAPQQVAIMAVGRVQRLPRFAEDGLTVVPSSIMSMSLGADHRCVL